MKIDLSDVSIKGGKLEQLKDDIISLTEDYNKTLKHYNASFDNNTFFIGGNDKYEIHLPCIRINTNLRTYTNISFYKDINNYDYDAFFDNLKINSREELKNLQEIINNLESCREEARRFRDDIIMLIEYDYIGE